MDTFIISNYAFDFWWSNIGMLFLYWMCTIFSKILFAILDTACEHTDLLKVAF